MDDQQKQEKRKLFIRSVINFIQGVALTLLIIAIVIFIYMIVLYKARVLPLTNYAIVFDAGSSHTEMFVYYWPADKSDGMGTTSSVNEYFVCPVAAIYTNDSSKSKDTIKLKAISDFEQHLDLLDAYFGPCLEKAAVKIPSDRHKYAPVFLGATAGMRLVKLRNVTKANQILETIREVFSHYPFQFVSARQVRILTGMEEAIDGWITTNILLEKFKKRHDKKKPSEQFDADMVGVLDLGGASTQVTFTYTQSQNDEPIPSEFTTSINLFDTVYNPYAHSYLCWGKNEAMKRHRSRLVNHLLYNNRNSTAISNVLTVNDPCLPFGISDTVSTSSLFRSPCTLNEKQKFTNYNENISSFVFIGKGNATKCRARLRALFDIKSNDKSVNCTYKKQYCTFDHTFQPPIPKQLHFIGLSGYYYVFHNLAHRMTKTGRSTNEEYRIQDYSQEEINRRLVNVCETPYDTLYVQESMNPQNEQHKRGLCFDAWYVWLLLTYGIGFKEDSDLKRVSFANKFPTGKVGWTLGYMINQTNYIPAEYREKRIRKTEFVSWVTVSSIVAFVTLLFLIATCQLYIRRACSKRTSHLGTMNNDGYSQPPEQSLA